MRSRPKQGPLRQAPVAGSKSAPCAWHSMAPPPVSAAVAAIDRLAAVRADVQVRAHAAVGEAHREPLALHRTRSTRDGAQLEAHRSGTAQRGQSNSLTSSRESTRSPAPGAQVRGPRHHEEQKSDNRFRYASASGETFSLRDNSTTSRSARRHTVRARCRDATRLRPPGRMKCAAPAAPRSGVDLRLQPLDVPRFYSWYHLGRVGDPRRSRARSPG